MTTSTGSPTGSPAGSPTRLTARTPEDLLAAAPVVLGFWPTHSVVMLTFGGGHPFHARVDLPDDRADLPELAATLAAPAVHHGVERVVLLVYADDPALGDAAWRALRAAFAPSAIDVVEALRVGQGRWFPLLGGDPTSRELGVSYDPGRLAVHPFLTQAVLDGRVTHGSRNDLAATLRPAPEAVAAVAAVLASRSAPHPSGPPDRAAELAEGTWAEALVARHVGAHTCPSDADAARLLVAMRSLRVRDAAWSVITRTRSRPAVRFFTDLVRRSPPDLLPAPAALLAWSAWQAGDGALAWCAIDRCRAVDADYGLTELIAEALERAVPPSVCADGFDWREGLDTA